MQKNFFFVKILILRVEMPIKPTIENKKEHAVFSKKGNIPNNINVSNIVNI